MSNILRGSALFIVGVGASVAVSWWLKQRDEILNTFSRSSDKNVGLDLSGVKYEPMSSDIEAITLPPEAFADIDGDDMVIMSEIVVDQSDPADDLTAITGIGQKTAETLHTLGIRTYRDLANADAEMIKDSVKRASLETIQQWIADAQELG